MTCPKFLVDRLRTKLIGIFSPTETFRAAFSFNTFNVKNSQIASFVFHLNMYFCTDG